MTDGEALLRAVCASPWDDLPRLVYADWLEENGRPERAEFIRTQCEYPEMVTSLPEPRDGSAADPDRARLKADLVGDLPRLPGVEWVTDFFVRGFPYWVRFSSTKAFAATADRVFTAAPVVRAEVRRVTPNTVRRVLDSRYAAQLSWLLLCPDWRIGGAVAACPRLGRLEVLLIQGSFTDACAEALAASPNLGSLTFLGLDGHSLTDRGALALAESPRLAGLSRVCFRSYLGLSRPVIQRLQQRFTRLE